MRSSKASKLRASRRGATQFAGFAEIAEEQRRSSSIPDESLNERAPFHESRGTSSGDAAGSREERTLRTKCQPFRGRGFSEAALLSRPFGAMGEMDHPVLGLAPVSRIAWHLVGATSLDES